ncbi:MAG TPA: hypothetical protein ENH70_03920, partial [Desulfobacteraceae bacterium]|nr:hypothetical protein [Desulfobacteraceae bacterium]
LESGCEFSPGQWGDNFKKTYQFSGDRSLKGLEESCGLMVNYVYSQNWFQRIRKSFQSLLLCDHTLSLMELDSKRRGKNVAD